MSEEDYDQTCSTICQSPSVTQHSKIKIQKNDKNETPIDILLQYQNENIGEMDNLID